MKGIRNARHIAVFTIFVILLSMFSGVSADTTLTIESPVITPDFDSNEYVFDINVSGYSQGLNASLILASYDETGTAIDKVIAPLESSSMKMRLPSGNGEKSYKIMLVDSSNLKPLCSAVEGELGWNYTVTELMSDDVISVNTSKYADYLIEYYKDVETGKEGKIYFTPQSITYNGVETYMTIEEICLYNYDVVLKFADSTGDGVYDILAAVSYVHDRVSAVDAAKSKMTLVNNGNISFDREAEIIFKDVHGNVLSLEDFNEGDVVAVMSDSTGNLSHYSECITVIKINDLAITGIVEYTTVSSNGCPVVGIGGKGYEDTTGGLCVGDEGTFYLGMTGKIIDFEIKKPDINYAYLLEGAKEKEVFGQTYVWKIKMLTKDGIAIYDIAKNSRAEVEAYFTSSYDHDWDYTTPAIDNVVALGITNAGANNASFSFDYMSNKVASSRLVEYKLNSNGEIRELKIANADPKILSYDEWQASSQTLGGAFIEEDALILDVSGVDAKETYTTDIGFFFDESKYSGFTFTDSNDEYSVVVITNYDSSFDFKSGFAVATGISYALDGEEEVIKVDYIKDGIEGTAVFDDDSVSGGRLYFYDISVGDILIFMDDHRTKRVSDYMIIAQMTGTDIEIADEILQYPDADFVGGYISNTSPKFTTAGEVLTISGQDTIVVTEDTNIYICDNTRKHITVKSYDDLISENVDYYINGEATPIFAKLYDGVVTDVYLLNQRMDVLTSEPVYTAPKTTRRNGETIAVHAEDIANPSDTVRTIEYYTENGIEKLTMNPSVTLTVNGVVLASKVALSPSVITDKLIENFGREDAMLTFEDTDKDGYYDNISGMLYETHIVEIVSRDTMYLMDYDVPISLTTDNADASIIIEDTDGNTLTAEDLKYGDVVSIATDSMNINEYDTYLRVVRVNNSAVSGTVLEGSYRDGYSYVVINGVEYADVSENGINLGDEGTFYTDIFGRLIVKADLYKTYGYLLEGAMEKEQFGTNYVWKLRMLTKDGIAIYNIAKNNRAEVESYFASYAADLGVSGYQPGQYFGFGDYYGDKAAPARLVEYKLNSNGEITSIDIASNATRVFSGKYDAASQTIGVNSFDDNTTIFDVSANDVSDTYTAGIDFFTDGANYTGLTFPDGNGNCSLAVITDYETKFDAKEGFAVITKISSALDNDEDVIRVDYIKDGAKGTAIFDDDSVSMTSMDFYQLEVGDVFTFKIDPRTNRVGNYIVLAQLDFCEIVLSPDAWQFIDADLISGYISNEEKTASSNGEIITINDFSDNEYDINVTADTNIYTYSEEGRFPEIITETKVPDGIYFDSAQNIATVVFVKADDNGNATDIYLINTRMDIANMTPVREEIEAVERTEKTIKVNYDDIFAADTNINTIAYFGENGREYLTLNETVTYTINNGYFPEQIFANEILNDIWNHFEAEYEFTDTDSDGYYDELICTSYIYDRVDSVDASNDKLTLMYYGTITFDFEDIMRKATFTDDAGNILTLSDFSEGDVIAFASNDGYGGIDRPRNYESIKIIKLTDSAVSGTVEAYYELNGIPYVTIGGRDYEDLTYCLYVGDEGIFYVTPSGKIVDYEAGSADMNYAYLLEGAKEKEQYGMNYVWRLKMLTKDGIAIYDIAENNRAEIESYFYDNQYELDISNADSNYSAFAFDYMSNKTSPARLVEYKLNSNGEIKELNRAATNVKSLCVDEWKADAQTIARAAIEDDALVFMVNVDDPEDTYVTGISALVDEAKYTGFTFRDSRNVYSAMVVTATDSNFSEETGWAVVTKVARATDEEGEDVIKVSYVQDEEEGTVIFDDDSNNKGYYDYYNLNMGDVFMFVADAEGRVSDYIVVVQITGNQFSLRTQPDYNGIYTQLGRETVLVAGYIANTKKSVSSSGERVTIGTDGYLNGASEEILVRPESNKYTYNPSGRTTTIEVGDFMAGDVSYAEFYGGNAIVYNVLARLVDGEVKDIYSINSDMTVSFAY